MSYTALYRKFRPRTFDEVKGQDHIVKSLKNQVKANRIGHAYLFCGTRGTGKTSIAKIFARAVNCENPVDGNPCMECTTCNSILAGSSMNVIEIDAASNNGVDSVRDIIEQVEYPPTEGRYKVFIIDEVHMLSTAAFNALLKTLEEPPSYVIFILATTEVHKIPITVLSRCQQYDFHRITIDDMKARMRELMEIESNKITDEALSYIAKAADGSMRDALSLLDQCMAFFMDEEVTLDKVLSVLGAVDQEIFNRLLTAIEAKDVKTTLSIVEEVVMAGRSLPQFVSDFTWYMRNLLLIKSADHMENVLDMSTETIEGMRAASQDVSMQKVIRYIRILSELLNEIRYSGQKRILIEVAFIKLCRPRMDNNTDALIDRINGIEDMIAHGGVVSKTIVEGPEAVNALAEAAPRPAIKTKEFPKAIPEDIKEAVKHFSEIATEMGGIDKGFLTDTRLNLNGDKLQIVFFNAVAYAMYEDDPERVERLADLIAERIGKRVELEITFYNNSVPYEQEHIDLSKFINMNIDIEDDDDI
ncbi:MAG: DNA polymerase III subunit gamma/tau [Lachnospiraceae bacterium]|nr:DNA polymerase III subunit gamma/tau [Lachnospiraceae bacterium]